MPERDYRELLRLLPATEKVLARAEIVALAETYGRGAVKVHVRRALAVLRDELRRNGEAAVEPGLAALPGRVAGELARRLAPGLVRVVNATGILLHTNLGRAPLDPQALARATAMAGGYANLEYRLVEGERGDRNEHLCELAAAVTGGESALVVNNNAAAVLLALNTLARGRAVVVSRGELVEIGGSFRLPDILAAAGVELREVGTTNRTRAGDFRAALDRDGAGAVLRVHPSNYRIEGFTERPLLAELAALAHERGLPLVVDQGSGAPGCLTDAGAEEEPFAALWSAGADLVCASADKLIGGPQAGIAAGRREIVATLAANPLARALRPDKLTVALLAETLAAHLRDGGAALPLARLAAVSADELERRAGDIAAAVHHAGLELACVPSASRWGGGTTPGREIESRAIAVRHRDLSAARLHEALRTGTPPVVGRIADDVLLLDLRAVFPAEDDSVVTALAALPQ